MAAKDTYHISPSGESNPTQEKITKKAAGEGARGHDSGTPYESEAKTGKGWAREIMRGEKDQGSETKRYTRPLRKLQLLYLTDGWVQW